VNSAVNHGADLAPLVRAAGIALGALALGTPLAWRALRGARRLARAVLGGLACVGAAAALALLDGLVPGRSESTVPLAVLFSLVLQGAAAPILVLLARREG